MRKLHVIIVMLTIPAFFLPAFADEPNQNTDIGEFKNNSAVISGRLAANGDQAGQPIKTAQDDGASGANVRNALCPKFVHILENSSGCAEIAPQKSHSPDDGSAAPAKAVNRKINVPK